ncbi:hypothetical protein V6N13_114643 [Hibiscus sabdariffa]|uniref:Uncharacterized protein n=1 Tax=Hibiscus sabdariffa TaxID=183260 RepID=A0ABR2U2Q3_9ROSI
MILCKPHKANDGSTVQAFMKSWMVFSCDSNGEIPNLVHFDLEALSWLFPPIKSMPDEKNLLLNDDKRKTRRSFEFDADVIATLILVNTRWRIKPRLSDYSIGNLYASTLDAVNPTGKDIDLSELGYLVRKVAKIVPNDSQDVLQGFKTMIEQLS